MARRRAGLGTLAVSCTVLGILLGRLVFRMPAPASASAKIQPAAVPAGTDRLAASRAADSLLGRVLGRPDSELLAARAESIRSTLQMLRATSELYRLQHRDQYPDFAACPGWEQLLSRTDETGEVKADGPCGPYLKRPPVNPFNGFSRVAVVHPRPSPGDRIEGQGIGWVFCSSNGHLLATDATGQQILDEEALGAVPPGTIVPPRSVDDRSRRASLTSQLQTLRSMLQLWQMQHNERLLDFARYPRWQQMVQKTMPDGVPSAGGTFGPYLTDVPRNPLNGFWQVAVIEGDPPPDYRLGARQVGYVYDRLQGRLWATDKQGQLIRE